MPEETTEKQPEQFKISNVEYGKDSIVSKTLYHDKTGSITLFAFDMGQKLSKHTAPFDAFVQILEGEMWLRIGEKEFNAHTGDLIFMPANIPHELSAIEKTKMALFMFKQ